MNGYETRPRRLPGFTELVAVEKPEDRADNQQHDLVEWSWDGQETQSAAPSKRPRDAAVADHDHDGAERASNEGACGPHAVSLGRELNVSRSGHRPRQPREENGEAPGGRRD